MVNAKEKLGTGDEFVLEKVKEANKPVFLIINKVDLIKKIYLLRV